VEVACIGLIAVAVLTVVGHGIWIVFASIVRVLFGPAEADKRTRACPRCGWRLDNEARECLSCGWPAPPGPTATTFAALAAAGRELDRLRDAQALDHGTHTRLYAAIETERQRLSSMPPPVAQPGMIAAPEAPLMADVVSMPAPVPLPPVSAPLGEPAAAAPLLSAAEVTAAAARRAQEYAQRQQQTPSEAPPTLAPPRRPFNQLLVAFLEEKNIRWGELVGGLLIVGCSIALVISFWAQIAQRPFLKFFLFNGVTASLFGMGLYIERRWKLPTTSHGLLIIASLLVPLNFLALAAFTTGMAASTPMTLTGELISICLFSWLLLLAGRVVAAPWPWLLASGVLIPAALALLVRRLVTPDSGVLMWQAIGLLLILVYAALSAAMIVRARRWIELDTPAAEAIFRLLGLITFATAVTCGLLLARVGSPGRALHELAWLVSLFAAPGLAAGLLVWKRVSDPALAGIRTAGTSIAVLAVLVLLAGIGLAWPDPAGMIPAAVLSFALLTTIAVLFEIPAAHLLAVACLAVAYLLAFHAARPVVEWRNADSALLAHELFSAASGSALIPLVAILGAAVVAGTRWKRAQDARFYGLAAGAIALVSLLLVTWHGFGREGDSAGATWVYGLYAVGALVAAGWSGRRAAAWTGCGLLLAAVVQGIVYRWGETWHLAQPLLTAVVTFGSVMALGRFVLSMSWLRATNADDQAQIARAKLQRALVDPVRLSALEAAGLATLYSMWLVPRELPGALAVYAVWLAAIWLTLSLATVSAILFWIFQATLSAGVVFAVASRLAMHSWYREARYPWLDPWSLQAHGIALAVVGLLWLLLRLALIGRKAIGLSPESAIADGIRSDSQSTGRSLLRQLLSPDGPACDRVIAAVVLIGLVVLSIYGVVPGVAQELSPRYAATLAGDGPARSATSASAPLPRQVPPTTRFEVAGIPHAHALQYGSWVLLALLLALLAAGAWTELNSWHLLGLFLTMATACPLLAGRWETDVAAASALRWYLTGFVVLGSVPIWFRDSIAHRAKGFGLTVNEQDEAELRDSTRLLVLSLAVAPPMLMAISVCGAAIYRAQWTPEVYSIYWILGVVAVTAGFTSLLLRWLPGMMSRQYAFQEWRASWMQTGGTLLLILGLAPLLAITLYLASTSLARNPILGPEPGTFFNRIGLAPSYALPVLVLGGVLVGYAVRERTSGFALAAGLLFHVGLTAAWLMTAAKGGLLLDAVLWVRLAHLNAVIACGYALAWMAAIAWWARRRATIREALTVFKPDTERKTAPDPLLTLQLLIGVALQVLVLVAAWLWLFFDPYPSPAVIQTASAWGWLAFVLAVAAIDWLARRSRAAIPVAGWSTGLLALASLTAFTACRWDTLDWLGYHTLMAGQAIVPWLVLSAVLYQFKLRRVEDKAQERPSLSLVAICGSIAVVLALRAVFGDPQAPWWSAGVLIAMSLLAVALALTAVERALLYAASMLLNLAVSLWWIEEGWKLTQTAGVGAQAVHFFYFNIIALTLPALAWAWLELRYFRPADRRPAQLAGFHRLAAGGSLWLLAGLTCIGLLADRWQSPLQSNPLLAWLAILSAAGAILACLWDPAARLSVAHLYLLGLIAIGATLDQFDLAPDRLLWTGGMILGAYSVATSYLWSRRGGLLEIAGRLRMPRETEAPFAGLWWLVPANLLCAIAVVIIAYWVDLSFTELRLRILMAMGAIAQAVAVGLLARGTRRSQLQQVALLLGVVGVVAWGWAWLNPQGTSGVLLNRAVVLMTVLAAMTTLYGLGPAKLLPPQNEWTLAARRLLPWLVGIAALSIAFVLAVEVREWIALKQVQIAAWALLTVSAALLGLAGAAIAAAVLPGRDPLRLSEKGRTAYIYAAEGLLALLFVHMRVTMPWLFAGLFTRYWPFIVMLISFVGVGLSELFRRKGRVVLSEPLDRTGVLLPILPVLGFWVVPSSTHYSLLLFAVGVLYAGLSVTRRSFGFGLLAALAANGGLWYFLHQVEGLGLLEHPQLWLIPPALCVLAATYLNREMLSDAQLTSIRYLTATTIYVASTADIFLIGVGQAPWLPLVLAGLSIAGVLAGIVLRVRAFLFLGTAFLVLALFTVIWYAAVDLEQTWLWSASGIVTGILIIAVFAVFEKKRQEILQVVEQLREWEA